MQQALAPLTLLALLVVAPAAAAAERVVVVCPDGWRPGMDRWADFRRSRGVELAFLGSDRFPDTIETGGEPFTLLLVGDGRTAGLPPARPPATIVSRYGPERDLASDRPHAERVDAAAVARLPFSTKAALAVYLDRVIARETDPVGDGERRLQIAAGVGGFSPLIDGAIEAAARRLVTDLAPPTAEVSLRRYGAAPAATPTVAARGGVWVWLGHGTRDWLPGVTPSGLVTAAGGADIAVLLACYAGDYEAAGECVAERLLRHPDGPLAVIASTRVSMPYGNTRLGGELLAAMGRRPGASIGGLFAEAVRASVAPTADPRLEGLDAIARLLGAAEADLPIERREHAAMYCLLGDPLARVVRDGATGHVASGTSTLHR